VVESTRLRSTSPRFSATDLSRPPPLLRVAHRNGRIRNFFFSENILPFFSLDNLFDSPLFLIRAEELRQGFPLSLSSVELHQRFRDPSPLLSAPENSSSRGKIATTSCVPRGLAPFLVSPSELRDELFRASLGSLRLLLLLSEIPLSTEALSHLQ